MTVPTGVGPETGGGSTVKPDRSPGTVDVDLRQRTGEPPDEPRPAVRAATPGLPDEQSGWPLGAAAVTTAVALGWQMSELYGGRLTDAAAQSRGSGVPAGGLPELKELPLGAQQHVALTHVHGRILRLDRLIADPECATWPLEETASLQKEAAGGSPVPELEARVGELNRSLLRTMACVDVRVGKGYWLGVSLERLCRPLDEPLAVRLSEEDVTPVQELLRDLVTALPDHAGEPVLRSVQAWAAYARATTQPPAQDRRRLLGRPVEAAAPVSGDALREQGKRWRGLLTGETRPTDLVSYQRLLATASESLKDMRTLAWSAVRSFWPALAGLFAVAATLFVVGLNVADSDGAKLTSTMVTVGAWVAATWRVVGPRARQVMGDLREPLMGAAWNVAVAREITSPAQVRATLR